MDWLNIHVSFLDSPVFLGSDPTERSTWLCLMRFCIGQENGGRIAECRAWKDRQWQQVVRVTHREVTSESRLWSWDGDDLLVAGYSVEKEQEVQAKRKSAQETNARRWASRSADRSATRSADRLVTKERDPEGKGKEEEGKGNADAAPHLTLSTWINTHSKDRARAEENRAALSGMVETYGIQEVRAAAEVASHAAGAKVWPEAVLPVLIARAKAQEPPAEPIQDSVRLRPRGAP